MSAKAGFIKFDVPTVAAMVKEFVQLNEGVVPRKPVTVPIIAHTLTDIERKKALPADSLIKEKRNRYIKGRSCVNGRKQWRYLKQDETISSSTALLESLLVILFIDSYEDRDVATYDVPGTHLQASLAPRENKERTLMHLVGEFVDIMYKVNPENEKNIIYEHGQKVLHMDMLQATYGCIRPFNKSL